MNWVGVYTIAEKDIRRNIRVPLQLIGTPVVTTVLYFLVFGFAIGNRVGSIDGLSYIEFIMPGLIMMNVLTSAFQSIAFSIMMPRLFGTLNDILVSPMSYFEITLGFLIASVFRSLVVGLTIFVTSLFFVPVHIDHVLFLVVFAVLVSVAFSLLGFIAGLWAKNFEQVSIFPTFIIMPLSFLGGVFYSIEMLPPFAQAVSRYNPILYMINGMRYAFYSISDIAPLYAVAAVAAFILVAFSVVWILLRSGYNLKT